MIKVMKDIISCKEKLPNIGDEIVYWYTTPSGDYVWCAGEVDGDNGPLFLDLAYSCVDIEQDGFWMSIPNLETLLKKEKRCLED